MTTLRRDAEFEAVGPAGAFILTDEEAASVSGGAKAFPVRLTVNGGTYALRLGRMGGKNLIGLARAVREEAGLTLGEVYPIEVALDEAPREVEVPPELTAALDADPAAKAAYEKLAFTHRKELARWVADAKREATRTDRVRKAVELVREGRHL